ncbi:MAG TPA: DUF1254 domain-containing protein, partial [Armatimonadota bacterium]|nr:DUF1254 domain-containing protein [Armatimonadota bacterium]
VLISETLMDSRSLFLTANTETIYNAMWLDIKDGPMVIEVPPKILGMIDDFWFRYVTDVGNVGPDKGQGGKYLLVPPDYTGDIPEGYFVARSRTYGNILFFRSFPVNGDLRPAVESTKQYFRVYPWAQADNPPEMTFVNFSGKAFNTIHASDVSFYTEVNQAIQEEPLAATDPETLGLLASIGIQRGKPFAPDARMQRSDGRWDVGGHRVCRFHARILLSQSQGQRMPCSFAGLDIPYAAGRCCCCSSPRLRTGAGCQLPNKTSSFGQYMRIATLKGPAGVGNQFASFSLPGEVR